MEIKYGITGNYYIYSLNKEEVLKITIWLNRSVNSIYWNNKYQKWVLRIKRKSDKLKIKNYGSIDKR